MTELLCLLNYTKKSFICLFCWYKALSCAYCANFVPWYISCHFLLVIFVAKILYSINWSPWSKMYNFQIWVCYIHDLYLPSVPNRDALIWIIRYIACDMQHHNWQQRTWCHTYALLLLNIFLHCLATDFVYLKWLTEK